MKLDTPAIQPYSRFMVSLYEAFSEKKKICKVDSPIFEKYCERIFDKYPYRQDTFLIPPSFDIKPIQPNNTVILAFSGGKDSLATAIKLKNQGKLVRLFFLQGINKSYTSEYYKSIELAKELGLNIIIWKVKQNGETDFKENPFKNGIILTLMAEAGYELGVSEYVLGNQQNDNLGNCDIHTEMSDSIEFFEMMQSYLNFIKINTYLINDRDSFETIYEYNPELLNRIGSCIMPVFRRPNIQKANLKNFGIEGQGCGSCYKCAMEYLFKAEKGMVAENKPYQEHCKKILKKYSIDF
jgi:7-cyano-7-deazaguanine synthase in queuosine biosynthesis